MSTRVRAIGSLAAVFVLGGAAGIATDRAWAARQSSALMSDEALIAAMRRELALDSTQEQQVRAILARHQREVDSAWTQIRPNVHAAIGMAQMEIAMLLRPDQRQRFRDWIKSAHPAMSGSGMMPK